MSSGEGMTMVLMISGGKGAHIEPTFMGFKNKNRNYPMKGIPDDLVVVSYRTGTKRWMEKVAMPQ